MKLLCVVQRYGPEVTGGSEALCRAIAQRLAATHDVSVATSCATDYVTWANVLPPGTSTDGAVTVHRFPSARERPLHEFWRLSDRVFDDAELRCPLSVVEPGGHGDQLGPHQGPRS